MANLKETLDAFQAHKGDVAADKLDALNKKIHQDVARVHSKDSAAAQEKLAEQKFRDEVLGCLNAKLFNNGRTLGKEQSNVARVVGTHHEGKENFLVFADYNTDPAKHHAYLYGKDHKFHEATVNNAARTDEAHRFHLTGKVFDDLPKGTDTAQVSGRDVPGVRTIEFPPTSVDTQKRGVDVVDASGNREWHIKASRDGEGKASTDSIVYREKTAEGGTITRGFRPDPNQKGVWLCNEKVETPGKPAVLSNDQPYWVYAGSSSIKMTALDSGYNPRQSDTVIQDGTRVAQRQVTDHTTLVAQTRWVTESIPGHRTDGFSEPTKIQIATRADGANAVNYTLTHKYVEGQDAIAIFTQDGDTSNPPKLYRYQNNKIEEFNPFFRSRVKSLDR